MDYLCEDEFDLNAPAASSSRCTTASVGSKKTSRTRANAKKEVAYPTDDDQLGQGAICVTDSVSRLSSNAAQNHGCTSDSAKPPKVKTTKCKYTFGPGTFSEKQLDELRKAAQISVTPVCNGQTASNCWLIVTEDHKFGCELCFRLQHAWELKVHTDGYHATIG